MHSHSIQHDKKTSSPNEFKKYKKRIISKACYSFIFGNVAIILGLSLIMFQTSITSLAAEKILCLNSDTAVFNIWRNYPMKIPFEVRFFNWTNHEDFFNKSVKPKFDEIGPYTYLQSIERVNIVRNDNNNTITFKQIQTFKYDNDLPTNGNLSDQLITINYITMLVGELIKDWHTALKDLFSDYVVNLNPHYYFNTTVDHQILNGSYNILLELLNYIEFLFPQLPRLDGLGWLKLRQGDPNFNGVYNVANGVNRQFDIQNWNYYNSTPYFNGSCNKVKGSLGDIYSFPLNKESIHVFTPELCRYMTFYFEKEVVVDGILGYKYSFTKMSVDNGNLNPENKCICMGPCKPPGLFNLFPCQYNLLNWYLSQPHFYNADPIFLDAIEGFNPKEEKHGAYIVVEPTSLLCLEFKIAAQLNVFLYPVEDVSYFDDYPKLHFPLLWFKMYGKIPPNLKKYLKIFLYLPYVMITTAIILISLGIYVICYGVYKFEMVCSLKKSQNVD